MLTRRATLKLEHWSKQPQHKPLIIRGARQVGKTTLVKKFGEQFDCFIYLNLELHFDRRIFEQDLPINQIIQAIFFQKKLTYAPEKRTLIFIDEIQTSPEAVSLLRYFYEAYPDIHVIATGSLLETLIDTNISFPVGRVEYLYLYPLTFEEFLTAIEEPQALEALCMDQPPTYAHQPLLELFHSYCMVGGMPEIVASFAQNKDLVKLGPIYESLLTGYQDDVEKYARDKAQTRVIRHIIAHASYQAGSRIKFQHFGQSEYGSRDVGEAMRILEKALLIKLVYPTTALKPPFEPNHKKSPRLQFLDTGLMNYSVRLQQEFFSLSDLNNLYQGKITEHIVGQQLLATETVTQQRLLFWVREKSQSSAEIDYVIPQGNQLIPIEIKSGKTGSMRSLHSFIDHSEHAIFAIRLYHGKFSRETITSLGGKEFELLSLPYYLCGQLKRYLNRGLSCA